MITTWGIAEFECYINQNGYKNVIKSITWSYIGVQDEYFCELNGVTEFELPTDEFIEFEDLTKEMVIQMLDKKLDIEAMNNQIQLNINNQINDKLIIIKPKW